MICLYVVKVLVQLSPDISEMNEGTKAYDWEQMWREFIWEPSAERGSCCAAQKEKHFICPPTDSKFSLWAECGSAKSSQIDKPEVLEGLLTFLEDFQKEA